MKFKESLKTVDIVGRKHRFIAEIKDINGNIKSAFLSNNTKMTNIFDTKGLKGLITTAPRGRRIPYVLEMMYSQGTLVGVNHYNSVLMVKEALENKKIPELSSYYFKKQLRLYKGAALELENSIGNKCMLIIRDIYLKQGSTLVYPDGICPHESSMLNDMAKWLEKKYRVVVLYVAQRNDMLDAKLGWNIDAEYATELTNIINQGAEILCYSTWLSFDEIKLKDRIEFSLV